MSRDRNPGAAKNWRLVCSLCKKPFRDQQQVRECVEHWKSEHGVDKVTLDLEWIGVGPAPRVKPEIPRWN